MPATKPMHHPLKSKPAIAAYIILGTILVGGGGWFGYQQYQIVRYQAKYASPILKGSLTLVYDDAKLESEIGEPCNGEGGYSDLNFGTQVLLKDGTNSILSTASLLPGVVTKLFEEPAFTSSSSGKPYFSAGCRFDFIFSDIPHADFYTIETGRRGGITFSKDKMIENEWTAELSIGG